MVGHLSGREPTVNVAPTFSQLSNVTGAAEKGRNPHRARFDLSSYLLFDWSSAAELNLSRYVHEHCSMFGAGRAKEREARRAGHGEINKDPHYTEYGEM